MIPRRAEIPMETVSDYGEAAASVTKTPLKIRIGIPRNALEGVETAILDAYKRAV